MLFHITKLQYRICDYKQKLNTQYNASFCSCKERNLDRGIIELRGKKELCNIKEELKNTKGIK